MGSVKDLHFGDNPPVIGDVRAIREKGQTYVCIYRGRGFWRKLPIGDSFRKVKTKER